MTADLLREAAALIRKRAGAATSGPWEPYVLGSEGYDVRGADVPVGNRGMTRRSWVARCGYETWETDKANAEHIAAADPPFMFAVADWLDDTAESWELSDQDVRFRQAADTIVVSYTRHKALAVARAYLGRAS